ncbi:MAG: lipid-A-disaccharide synthase N-terminal domain-containing protein [Proteobacteria bacterium]|nr:lipid-A-disaccharide synthase N-terminal domain-containing protein [Pseudomonadota bacterium]
MDWMNREIVGLAWTGLHMTPWKLIGLTGALMFAARWLVQFLASRSAGRPVIPRAFWVMSLAGSAMTLAYFACSAKQDAVGVLQNLFPAFTAAYSLYLDLRTRGGRQPLARDAVDRAANPASTPTRG